MGIVGLQQFMLKNSLCEQVELSEIAGQYRDKTGKDPVLIVDISNVVGDMYTPKPRITLTLAGDLKKFIKNLENFVHYCTEHGIKLKIFMDGRIPVSKQTARLAFVWKILSEVQKIYSGKISKFRLLHFRGLLVQIACKFFKSNDNCEFSRGIGEADPEIFKFVKEEQCFAVLSTDTDFLSCDNFHYCLTPNKSVLDPLNLLHFSRNKLAAHLQINTLQFPLFFALCKSYADCTYLNIIYKVEGIGSNLFSDVAKLSKKFSSGEKLIDHYSELLRPEEMKCLKRRLLFYQGIINEGVATPLTKLWEEILVVARERHTTGKAVKQILGIIEEREFTNPIPWEDPRRGACGSDLLPFRKYMYGILFFENPSRCFIKEKSFVFSEAAKCASLEVRKIGFDRVQHLGLLKLWSPLTPKEEKKKVFYGVINKKPAEDAFYGLQIPEEYALSILSAYFLLWELPRGIELFEAETILVNSVLVNNSTWEEIEKYPAKLHLRALDLSARFLTIVEHLELLNSVCGDPIPVTKASIEDIFDGKIIHYVYGRLEEGEDPSVFFDEKEDLAKTFSDLRIILFNLGRTRGKQISSHLD